MDKESFLKGYLTGLKLGRKFPLPISNQDLFLTFSSSFPDKFAISAAYINSSGSLAKGKFWDGVLEYSLDKQNWNEWDGKTNLQSGGGELNQIFLRGSNNTSFYSTEGYSLRITGISKQGGVSCSGNLKVLLDYESVKNNIDLPLGERCFQNLFRSSTSLESIASLIFPTNLAKFCYASMFEECTFLTSLPPTLPATTLANNCYTKMFAGCTSLTSLPNNFLPATSLALGCYFKMFAECTSLTSLPEGFLPATILTNIASIDNTFNNGCYGRMFENCTSLTTLPKNLLPAIVLSQGCYREMFAGCTSLTSLPEGFLPATTLANYCYVRMFAGCTSLTSLPKNLLPALILSIDCYNQMFYHCTSLISLPRKILPATTLAKSCYTGMFQECNSLNTLPALPATALKYSCYSNMFNGCTNIKLSTTQTEEYNNEYTIPPTADGTTATSALNDMFANTGGTFTGTPTINTTYYTSNEIIS